MAPRLSIPAGTTRTAVHGQLRRHDLLRSRNRLDEDHSKTRHRAAPTNTCRPLRSAAASSSVTTKSRTLFYNDRNVRQAQGSSCLIGFVCLSTAIPLLGEDGAIRHGADSGRRVLDGAHLRTGCSTNWACTCVPGSMISRSISSIWIRSGSTSTKSRTATYARFTEATGRRKPFHWIGGKIPVGQGEFPSTTSHGTTRWPTASSSAAASDAKPNGNAPPAGGVEKTHVSVGHRSWGTKTRRQAGEHARRRGTDRLRSARVMVFPNGPVAVGSFAPNGFGLYDVIGNVWEWVNDWYDQILLLGQSGQKSAGSGNRTVPRDPGRRLVGLR